MKDPIQKLICDIFLSFMYKNTSAAELADINLWRRLAAIIQPKSSAAAAGIFGPSRRFSEAEIWRLSSLVHA